MDIGNLFENLDEDYKDFLLAVAVGFPLAYVDCWKLHIPFRDYDLMQQIILALGIDIIFVGVGISYCLFRWLLNYKNPVRPRFVEYNIVSLIYILGIASAFLLIGNINSVKGFQIVCNVFFFIPLILTFVEGFVKNKKEKRNRQNNRES